MTLELSRNLTFMNMESVLLQNDIVTSGSSVSTFFFLEDSGFAVLASEIVPTEV